MPIPVDAGFHQMCCARFYRQAKPKDRERDKQYEKEIEREQLWASRPSGK